MRSGTREKQTWRAWLGLAGWALAAWVVLAGVGFAVIESPLRWLSGFLPVALLLILATWAQAAISNRRRRAQEILAYVSQAVRLNLPIPAVLWAAEQSERRRTASRLHDLRSLLDRGVPLETALAHSVPEISDRAVRQIGAAERLGQLPDVLARLSRSRQRTAQRPEETAFLQSYPPAMMLILAAVGGINLIFVMPKFQQILRDFKLPMPPITLAFLEIAQQDWVGELLTILALIWIGQIFAKIFRVADSRFGGGMLDYIAWWTPFLHGRILARDMADLCRVVAGAVGASWTLHDALREAAESQSNAVMRRRTNRWRSGINAGLSLQQAAQKARMPKLMLGMLSSVRADDDLANVMNFLARHYDAQFSRAETLLRAAAVPVMALVMGACVLFVSLSLLMPLVELTESLAGRYPGFVR